MADLERLLTEAGPSARALVVPERLAGGPGHPLYAVNVRGRVRWFDHRSGDALEGPTGVEGTVRSLDMDAQGTLLDRSRQAPQQGWKRSASRC